MGDNNMTSMDYESTIACYLRLRVLAGDLLETQVVCSEIINDFGEAYIGDAKAEIDIFLSSLSAHLQRLAAFYYKMSDYLMTTSDSFKQTDYGTAQNMEG